MFPEEWAPPNIRWLAYPTAITMTTLTLAGKLRLTPRKSLQAFAILHGVWFVWWSMSTYLCLLELRRLRAQAAELERQIAETQRHTAEIEVQNLERERKIALLEVKAKNDDQAGSDADDEDSGEEMDEEFYHRPLGPQYSGSSQGNDLSQFEDDFAQ